MRGQDDLSDPQPDFAILKSEHMNNVLIAGAIHEAGQALLDQRTDVRFEMLSDPRVSDINERIEDVHGIVLRLTPLPAETISRAKRLKIVSRHGVGYDNVDVDALSRQRIPLSIVGDVNAVPVAEHAFSLMLAIARKLVILDHAVRNGPYGIRNQCHLTELQDKAILIVGFGRIGRQMARRAAAFDMNVTIADPFANSDEVELAGYDYVKDFRDALPQADFVSLHLPGDTDNGALIRDAELEEMKPGAFLINTGRGTLICEDALARALTTGQLGGVGLDVTRDEPPDPNSPLLKLENIIFSPHCAAHTEECMARMSKISAQNVLDAIDGALDPELVVNREVLGH